MKIGLFFKKVGEFIEKYDVVRLLQFSLMNGVIWMLLSIIYLKYMNMPEWTWEGVLYSVIFAVGHLGAFSLGLYLLLQILRFAGKKFCNISAVFFSGLLTFLLVSDIIVYGLYRFHINIPMLGLFLSPAAFELVEFPLSMIFMVILLIIIVYVGAFFLLKLAGKFRVVRSSICWVVIMALSFLGFNAIHAWAAFNGNGEILVRTDALPLKYAMTATRVFMRHGLKPAERINNVNSGSVIKYPLNKLQFKNMPKRKNVIMIVVDSLRADMLTPEIMPYMSSLGSELNAADFRKHFSGGNCTKTGIFSLFYGIPGNYFDQALRSARGAAMIDSMLELGYDVKVFSSGTLLSPPFNRTIFANVKDIELKQAARNKIKRDEIVIKKCKKFLQENDGSKPYFVFLFLDAVHGSCVPDDFEFKFPTDMKKMNFLTLGTDEKTKKDGLNLMKNSALYMDSVLQELLESINVKKRISDDTVLIFTSDHGNEAAETEMKNWGHNSNFARYQTMSPLLLFGFDRPGGKKEYVTSGLDISATVIQDVLGCTNPIADYSSGRNLFDTGERDFIISSSYLETAIIYKDQIFVQTLYGVMQKYDLNGNFIDADLPANIIRKYLKLLSTYSK